MSTELERTLARELDEVARNIHVPPMPSLPTASARPPLVTRIWPPLLVAAAAVALIVGGLALVVGRPGTTPPPTATPDVTISAEAPTVPYIVDQRLYVDRRPVPGTWLTVESRRGTWLALDSEGSWWSGGPGRDPARIDAEIDQPPVLSPDGRYVALVDLSSGDAVLTGFGTGPAGEDLGAAPVDLPVTESGVPIRVRAVTDDGDVVVQGRRTSLLWRSQQDGGNSVIDLAETAPDQQVRAGTAAGLVVVDGVDSDPQTIPAYLADVSADGKLTRTGTLPTYDDLAISPGGTWLVRSPAGTLGGEVASVATLEAQSVTGGDETTLSAPDGWGFAVGTWTWEDDQDLVAVLLPSGGEAPAPRLARCSVTVGECRALAAPTAAPTQARPTITASTPSGELSAESALDSVVAAVVAGDRDLLRDQGVIGDGEWEQLVGWAAGGGGSGSTCRDNGGGTQDCEIVLEADPGRTYYAILTPAENAYGWKVTYVSIATG